MKLKEVAEIRPGLPFRTRIESEADGDFVVIQARDLGADGYVHLDGAARLRALPGPKPEFLQAGEIALQPRGTRFSAAQFEPAQVQAVAAAPLYVLRIDPARVVSDFLVAVLMAPATQAALRQAAVGTYVPQVPRQAIADLRIDLPDLSSQTKLAALARLHRQEAELMERLRAVRARYFERAIGESARQTRSRASAGAH